jgi:hypothetical protein
MARIIGVGFEADAFTIANDGSLVRRTMPVPLHARASRQRRKWLRKRRTAERDWQTFVRAFHRTP